MHVRKGDVVVVIAGNDKGKQGAITRVHPAECRVVVEGETVQVMFDYGSQRPTRIPADLLAAMADFEGGPLPPRPSPRAEAGA